MTINHSRPSKYAFSVLMGAALALAPAVAQADSWGIHFLGDGNDRVTAEAGVVPISIWNNVNEKGYTTPLTITNSDGTQTATLTMSGPGLSTGWHSPSPADGGNGSLLRGYLDAANGNPTKSVTNVISGLPSGSYDVYLYAVADRMRPTNTDPNSVINYLPNYSVNGVTNYTATLLGGPFGGFIQGGVTNVNMTNAISVLTYGNYIVVSNVFAENGIITVIPEADGRTYRSPLNGIELVASSVVVPPGIVSQTASLTNYAGSTIKLSVSASGSPLNFQWKRGAVGSGLHTNLVNAGNISGANSSTLTITNAAPADQADYIVEVSNSGGTVTSLAPTEVFIVNLILTGPTPTNAAFYPGITARVSIGAVGANPITYQWRKNGNTISGATNSVLSITNFGAGDVATYDVVATTPFGSSNSLPASLTLAPAPDGAYAQAVVALGPVAYWRLNETAGSSTPAFDYAGGHTGTYGADSQPGTFAPDELSDPVFGANNYCLATAPGNMVGYASCMSVTPDSGLNLNTNTVTISAWFDFGGSAGLAGLIMQRDASGVGGLATLANGNLGYNWNNESATYNWDSGLQLPFAKWTFVTLVVTPTNATIYMYNSDGQRSATFVHNHANLPFSGLLHIGDDPGFNGIRTFSGYIDEVAIFNRALSANEVAQLYTAFTHSDIPPTIAMQPKSASLMRGGNASFAVLATGSAPLSYQWQKNGTNLANQTGKIVGANASTLSINNVAAADSATYTVIVSNRVDSVTSSPAVLSVLATNYDSQMTAFGPVGYWRLNEQNGTVAADSSGHGLNGTYQAGVSLGADGPGSDFAGFDVSDRAGTFQVIAAKNSYVALPAWNLNTNTVTMMAWIRPVGTQGRFPGIVYWRGSTASGLGLQSDPGRNLTYAWNDDSALWSYDSGLTPPVNQWCFVALVVEPTQATLYLGTTNGLTSVVNTHAHAASSFNSQVNIGFDSHNDGNRSFSGNICEVAVFNYSMSSDQIGQVFSLGTSPILAGPEPPAANLTVGKSGNNIQIMWSAGTLLESTNIAGPWTPSGVPSPYIVTPNTQAQKFYRVQVQ